MIKLDGMISMEYIKKSPFSGSYQGMRYRIFHKKEDDDIVATLITIWKEPFSYEYTPKEMMKTKTFPYHLDGLQEGIMWLNEEYEKGEYVNEAYKRV